MRLCLISATSSASVAARISSASAPDAGVARVVSMVSIRRRRYLGLCSGKSSFPVVLPKPIEHNISVDNSNPNVNISSTHAIPLVDASLEEMEDKFTTFPGSSNAFDSSMSTGEPKNYCPGKEINCRKRHRKRHYENQKPCIMRGVYFKNMKWQAAIKVDKKQIHLGTVGSQEEAAQLYDRAAFMCGREPNFELSEREKEELRRYDWEEFLALTRSAINNKSTQNEAQIYIFSFLSCSTKCYGELLMLNWFCLPEHQRKFCVGKQNKLETKTTDSNWEHEGAADELFISDDDDDDDDDVDPKMPVS